MGKAKWCLRRDCQYFSMFTGTCDYMLHKHQRRGCPVDACTKYTPASGARLLADYYAGKAKLSEKDRILLTLYDEGLSDREIGERAGLARSSVAGWRIRMGLPSKREQEEISRGD